jgi:hypothetical protein
VIEASLGVPSGGVDRVGLLRYTWMVMRGEKSQTLMNHKAQEGTSSGEKSWALAHTGSGTLVGMFKLD